MYHRITHLKSSDKISFAKFDIFRRDGRVTGYKASGGVLILTRRQLIQAQNLDHMTYLKNTESYSIKIKNSDGDFQLVVVYRHPGFIEKRSNYSNFLINLERTKQL